ncbi:hypothetical protein AHAS_Ahas13G0025800 [Arachis hypogaea]
MHMSIVIAKCQLQPHGTVTPSFNLLAMLIQDPSPMEESSVIRMRGGGGRGEGDSKRKKVLEEEVVVVVEELEEEEGFKTPTWQWNKIPKIENCPNAPRKKRRRSSQHMKRSSSSSSSQEIEFNFGVMIKHDDEEVESFFQSMFELSRVNNNKRCKSI